MNRASFGGDLRLRTATTPGARWLTDVRLWRPGGDDALHTEPTAETAVVLLSGTFDLFGNGTAWPARGARTTPFQGRPMAVYLPPAAELGARNGPADGCGELLLIAAQQPTGEPAPEGRDALSHKPLLPLAGSGKSFDPATGEWRPAETFASAAESLPPRRFRRLTAGAVAIERMFAPDYKAATLSVDEAVVPQGSALRLGDIPELPACDELLLFVRPERTAHIEHDGTTFDVTTDELLWQPVDGTLRDLTVHARDGACYLVIAYAGK